jgi:glycosyltransferase involved in cell wall biosynthesis/O-antigen/teichoic acid export membrane protein
MEKTLKADFGLKLLLGKETFSALAIMGMRVGMLAAKLFLSIFMARYMGLKELGIYGLIVGASGTVQAVLRGGIFLLISRDAVHLPRQELMHDVRHYVSGILTLYSFLFCAATFAGQYWGQTLIAELAVCVFLTEHLAFDGYVLLNNLQYPKLANLIYCMQSAIWIYLFVICAFFYEPFRSLETILIFWTGGGLISLGIIVWLSRGLPWKAVLSRKVQWRWYAEKIRTAFKLYLSDVLGVVNYYLDRYIVSLFLSLEMTGVYVFFSQIMTANWNLINSGILAPYAPHLIKAYDASNTASFNSLFRRCIKRTYTAATGLALVSGVAVLCIVRFTEKKALLDHMSLLWVMLVALLFKIGATCAGSGLYAMHKDRESFMTGVITILITATVGSAAVYVFGVYGAAFNIAITSALSMVYAKSVWNKNSKEITKSPDEAAAIRTKRGKPENILIISSIFPTHVFGGAEIAAYNRAALLAKRGYNVSVVTLHEKDVPAAWGDLKPEGFRLYRIKMPRRYTLFGRTKQRSSIRKLFWHLQDYFDVRNGRKIGAVLDHAKPDHIEIDNIVGIGFNALSEIGRRNISVAYILHDLNLVCFRTCMFRQGKVCQRQCVSCRMTAKLRQAPLKKISRLGFISPSQANLDIAKRFVPMIRNSPSCVIRNVPERIGPSLTRERSDEVRLLYAGRLDPVKGVEFLLDVLAPLSRTCRFHLTVLGTGPCEQKLRDKYKWERWVTFRGFVSRNEVTEALAQHDIYCIPSLMPEAYGLATAQALQLGTPVIGSNIGGTTELIRDGVTGMLVPAGDGKAWTEAFSEIFSNRGLLDEWRKNVSAHAHEFDADVIGQAHEEFICRLYTQTGGQK